MMIQRVLLAMLIQQTRTRMLLYINVSLNYLYQVVVAHQPQQQFHPTLLRSLLLLRMYVQPMTLVVVVCGEVKVSDLIALVIMVMAMVMVVQQLITLIPLRVVVQH
jgi:hypothetical protein